MASNRRNSSLFIIVLFAFALSIDVALRVCCVVEDLFWTEEATNLNGSILHRVGGMDDVLLVAHGVVTTDSTGGCFTTIGDTSHGTYYLNGVNTRDSEGYDR
jgi:hypothetical protein